MSTMKLSFSQFYCSTFFTIVKKNIVTFITITFLTTSTIRNIIFCKSVELNKNYKSYIKTKEYKKC